MIDFGIVDAVDAEAIGEPGRRTFRVRARAGSNDAALWIEKEQLSSLGRAISQVLAERSRRRGETPASPGALADFAARPDVELQVVRLGLDFEPDTDRIILLADDRDALERGNTPAFRMELSHPDALALVREISQVVSAGRPLCPLCGRPLEDSGPHFCPGSNGHSQEMPIPRADGQDED